MRFHPDAAVAARGRTMRFHIARLPRHLVGGGHTISTSTGRQLMLPWAETLRTQLGLDAVLPVPDDEHRDLVASAARDNTLSFGFSAGGCLFPYYIGVSAALQDAGILGKSTKLGGASAGSLIAACVHAGMPLDDVTEQCLRLMHDCRVRGTRGRLGPVLRTFLEDKLPENAHEKCSGRTFVAVTKAAPYVKAKLISNFHDRDDLVDALMTSCHIPYWLDGRAVTKFRGKLHLDGGLTNFIPLPPQTMGIRVCCFPSKQLSYGNMYRIGISPDSFEPWPYTLRQMVAWAFEPASDDICAFLIEKGKQDAQAWMESMGLEGQRVQAEHGETVERAKATAANTDAGDRQGEAVARGKEELEEKKTKEENMEQVKA